MNSQITDLTGSTENLNTGCVKLKAGKLVMDKAAMRVRRNAYKRQLCNGGKEELKEESNVDGPFRDGNSNYSNFE